MASFTGTLPNQVPTNSDLGELAYMNVEGLPCLSLSGGTITGNTTVVGNVTGNTFVSTIATGTAPLTVSSTTVVPNLNSDFLDGQHGSYYTELSTSAFTQANSAYTKANTIPALTSTSIKTTNYTASVNDLVRCNTAAGAFSVTFPASPTDGATIAVLDIAGTFATNNLTLLPNGKTIESDATSFILDLNSSYASFVYNSATSNWKVLETPVGITTPTLISTNVKTSNYTATGNDLVRCNTAAGAFSVTFPSSPTDGSLIGIIDVGNTFATNNLTLLPNGKTIEFDATSVILDLTGTYVSFLYNASTSNWKLLQIPVGITIPSAVGNTGNFLISTGLNWVSSAMPPAFDRANAAFTQANTGITVAQAAFAAANTGTVAQSAYTQANSAYTQANTGVAIANAAFAKANSAGGGVALSNDLTTNYNYNILLANSSSGTLATANTSNTKLYFNANTGTLYSTIFQSLSDETVKNNIMQISNSLSKVNEINGVEFTWKDNGKSSAGVIAQQLEQILPMLVNTGDNGLKSVNYSGIIGYLIEAIKELNQEIIILKNIVNK